MPLNLRRAKNKLRKKGVSKERSQKWLNLHRRVYFARNCLVDSKGNPWVARDYQIESLESYAERKVHCDGRDVGKTSEIETIVARASVMRPHSEMLVATQCESHLFPLMNRLVRRIESTPAFAKNLVEIRRTPSWYLRFSNGFTLWGRIAEPRGINFQGLHVDWQLIDEAQEMTETAWGELYQALNGGGQRWVYGVSNGLRNTFYRMTQMQNVEQFNWPSSLNPNFTPEKDLELAQLYGGKRTPGYIHRVLGQHGAPAHGVFDLDAYLACVDEAIPFENIELTEEDTFAAPADVPKADYYLGCDLGYARDPSEFVIYRATGPDLINVLRVHLQGVNYAKQQHVIAELDRAYHFRQIGIDAGNSGRAVAHNLRNEGGDWCEKVQAFEFGSSLTLEPHENGAEHRRPIKPFMTELLERRIAERTIIFPRLPERESQYASHTYTVGHHGRIIYDKGNDHLIDADRCALLAHYLDTQQPQTVDLGAPVESFGKH